MTVVAAAWVAMVVAAADGFVSFYTPQRGSRRLCDRICGSGLCPATGAMRIVHHPERQASPTANGHGGIAVRTEPSGNISCQ